jgi:hypothetical protein
VIAMIGGPAKIVVVVLFGDDILGLIPGNVDQRK